MKQQLAGGHTLRSCALRKRRRRACGTTSTAWETAPRVNLWTLKQIQIQNQIKISDVEQ